MTTTHLDLSNLPAIADPVPEHTTDSPSSHSSFSSAYAEQPEGVKEQNDNEGADQGTEVSDDYAMTFDSDAEDQADKEEPAKAITEAIVEPDTQSLPILAENPSALEFSTPADLTYAVSDVLKTGQNILQALTHINPPPTHSTSTEIPEARASDEIVAHTTTEPADSASNLHDDAASGGIDIQQLLDNITANAEKNAPPSANATQLASSGALPKSTSSLPTHSSLPPRPNIPQKRPHEDIQKYHAGVPGVPPAATAFRAGATGSLVAAGAPGTSTDPRGGLPPPPAGSFQAPPSGNIGDASYPQINRLSAPGVQTKSIESQDEADDLDAKWGPDVQKIYDQFIDNERMYVTEGLWDRFPVGSRLFIGNLPSEKVTKRDLFHVFHKYGKIAQISIKQAYGFVQFHEASACYNALKREEGSEVRGRKMHLEISKPQKNTRNAQNAGSAPTQRSRSPDRTRGAAGRGVDRYDGNRGGPRMGQDEYGRPLRIRDDYRPVRSPTPPRGSFRGRDEYMPRGGRDSYETRDRRRSRSRSPSYGRNDGARYRERSPSPRTREAMEDATLQIPRRDPRDVPDVQLIILENLDPQFVTWIQNEMRGRVKVDVLRLDPRLPLQAVVRRQILEGVHAVSKLDLRAQNSSKIPLQVFDRQGGTNNVRFDEYQDLDPKIAAEVVLRAKNTHQPPLQVQNAPYIPPQYQAGPPYQPPAPVSAPQAPNIASLMGQLDNATLQKLLGSLGATQPQQQPQQQPQSLPQQHNPMAANANAAIDIASLLGGFQQQQHHVQPQQPYQQPMQPQYQMPAGNPEYGMMPNSVGMSPQQQPPPNLNIPQQSAQQVQNIMAQLARYRQ